MSQLRAIEAEIDVPEVVLVTGRAKTVTLDVRVTLRNNGEEDVVVHAPSGDDRHFWHVFDDNHREIQREKPRAPARARPARQAGVHPFRGMTVAAGHEAHATRRLKLDAQKLRAGQSYTVRAEFYGHIAEDRFTVVGKPAMALLKPAKKKATAKRPKKGAKKKAAKKKASKTAKKKTASKAAPKKVTKKKVAK